MSKIYFQQVKTLLWRNVILIKREKIFIFMEIVIPTIIVIFISK